MVNNSIKVVGQIRLGSSVLDVYDDLDEPLFKAADIANIIEYSYGNTWRMLDMCEADEKLNLSLRRFFTVRIQLQPTGQMV